LNDREMPVGLVPARRTPILDLESLPAALARAHRTTVWARIQVDQGTVRFCDLQGEARRDVRLEVGDSAVIAPEVEHLVEPSTDARFFVQFYREPGDPLVPVLSDSPEDHRRRSGSWEHRGRDLDSAAEIFEMVTRQYVDVVQDELLQPHFDFGPGFIDWRAHIGAVTDYWCHVVLYAPDYEIDVIEHHRPLHERAAFGPALFDRWLNIFSDTVDGGWTGPNATRAKKRATGMARAMAHRLLGKGTWHPADSRS
jgi:hemoglobin